MSSSCAADEAAARLAKETGHPERVAALAVDVSDPKSVEAAAADLDRDYGGKLGGLINNAAVCCYTAVVAWWPFCILLLYSSSASVPIDKLCCGMRALAVVKDDVPRGKM